MLGLIAAAAAWRIRRRRSNRLQLRLLAGRRRLLGEEIDSRMQRLQELDGQDLTANRRAAEGILDGLHVALLDREAHLQNLQDLAHLQQHKLKILNRHQDETTSSVTPDQATPVADKPPEGVVESRENLEDQFLQALQKRDDAPRPRPRRR